MHQTDLSGNKIYHIIHNDNTLTRGRSLGIKVVTAQVTTSGTRVREQMWPREPPASPLHPLTHLTRWAHITIHHLRPSKCKCDIRPTCHQNHSPTVNDVLPSHLGLNLRVNLSSKFELRHDRYKYLFPIFIPSILWVNCRR